MKKKGLLAIAMIVGAAVAQTGGENPRSPLGLHNATFVVKLLSPLSTRTAQPGYAFTALVEQPSQFQGAVIEGRIKTLKRAKKGVGKGKAEIEFQFDRLTFQGQTSAVQANLTNVENSQGVRKVDEEGRAIGVSSNKKRVLSIVAGSTVGAVIGGVTGGPAGAITGGAAGAALGLAIGLRMTTTGSDIEFKPGSIFTLSVSDASRRSGSR